MTTDISGDLRRNWFLVIPLAVISFIIAKYGLRLVDDGYYYLQIAYNIAHGKGPTFDGIHPTNGFEPLWELVLVPLFWVFGNKLTVAYAATFLEVALFVGTGVLLSRLAWKLSPTRQIGWFVCILWAFNPIIVNVVCWNGMETALLGFLVVWSLVAFNEYLTGKSSALRLGFLAMLCSLARLDAMFLGLVLAAQLIVMKRPQKDIVAFAIPFVAGLGTYIFYNLYFFGHPGPVSAYYYTVEGQERLVRLLIHGDWQFFHFFVNNLLTLSSFSGRLSPLLSTIVCSTLVGLVCLLLIRVNGPARSTLTTILFYCVLIVGAYAAFYDDVASTYTYYWLPLFLAGVIVVSLIPSVIKNASVRYASIATVVIIQSIVGALYAIDLSSLSKYFEVPQKATAFAALHIPRNARVGSWDAGYFGYFSHFTVINLDGLVNNYTFLDTLRTGRLADYITNQRIEYLANIDHPTNKRHWMEDNFQVERVYDDTTTFARFGTRFSLHKEVIKNQATLSGIGVFFIYRLVGRKHEKP